MKKKLSKLIKSFTYAFSGIKQSYIHEQNLTVHTIIMIIAIIFGFIYNISNLEWIILVILFALVIGSELINTAIENLVDMITIDYSLKAKIVKDVAAGSVLVFALGALISGLIIFIPKIF